MAVTTDPYMEWLRTAAAGEQTLSERYLGTPNHMLNADEVADVANKLWHEFHEARGDAAPKDWVFVRGGSSMVEIKHEDTTAKVARFCGGWPVASDKTAAMLSKLVEAAG